MVHSGYSECRDNSESCVGFLWTYLKCHVLQNDFFDAVYSFIHSFIHAFIQFNTYLLKMYYIKDSGGKLE